MEIFLTTVCFVSAVVSFLGFRKAVLEREAQTEDLKIMHRFLHKMPSREDIECRFKVSNENQMIAIRKVADQLRVDIITQMGDLATKHDLLAKDSENAKLKDERYKNMRKAFGGKEED